MPRFPHCRLAALVLLCGFLSLSVRAQETQTKPDPLVSQTFGDYFTELAVQNHLIIAAENIPLRLSITSDEKKELATSVRNLSLQKNIAAQAAFFDYQSQFIPPNIFVLRKKYTSTDDLPYVSLDEAAHFMEVAQRFISRYKSPFKNGFYQDDPVFMETARSFTPAQIALMKQNNLPVSALLPEQREQMWNVMRCFYIDNGALSVSSFLVPQYRLSLIRTETDGGFQHYAPGENPTPIHYPFGFAYPTPKDRYFKTAVIPLSFREGHHFTAQGEARVVPEKDADGNPVPFHDASEPTEADRTAAEAQARALASPTVLTFQTLARNLTNASEGQTTYIVDDALQSNPVSLFGRTDDKANREAVFTVCAKTYDLRVADEKSEANGRILRLTRPFVSPAGRLEDLPNVVYRLLPGPYARSLHLPEMNTATLTADVITARTKQTIANREMRRARGETVPDLVITETERKRRAEEREKNQAVWAKWVTAPDGMEKAALRRLRVTVEPKAKAAPDKKAPLSALDDTEKNALTIAVMYAALDRFQGFCLPHLPVYVERFDEMMIGGKPYFNDDKVPCLEFQLGFVKPNGDIDTQTGFGVYLEDPYPYEMKAMQEEAARRRAGGR